MQNTNQTITLSLRAEDIDSFSEWLEELQVEVGVERRNRFRVRLLMEDILLRLCDRFGAEATFSATCEFPLARRPRLRLEIKEEAFNPLGVVNEELGSWESSLATAIGLSMQYRYEGNCNVLKLVLPRPGMNPVIRIAIAITLGALMGTVGRTVLPAHFCQATVRLLLAPLYQLWNRTLNAISGPIIFLSVVTTVLNTRRIDEHGGSSARVIVRYFALSIAVVTMALCCAQPLFSVSRVSVELNEDLLAMLVTGLITTIPANALEPFTAANTAQLLIIAFALGYVLTRLEGHVDALDTLIRQANMVGLQIARWVSWFVPLFAGTFLCLELWQDVDTVIMSIWQPLVIALALSTLIIGLIALLVSQRLSVRPLLLLQKMSKPFFIAFKSGSLDDSFASAQTSCIHLLGIHPDYVKVGLPQGLVLYMPASAIGTIVFTLFAAWEYNVPGNAVWFVSAIVMAVVVFVATPPVPGANLLAYVALFATLGIPEQALLDAMIYDILFGISAGAANQTLLQMEMLVQANKYGMLDKDILRQPMGTTR